MLTYHPIEIVRGTARHKFLVASGSALPVDRPWQAFIASRKVKGADFLAMIDWAEAFPAQEVVLATGHHSPVEKEVARILLRRGGHVVVLPARAPLKQVPPELKSGFLGGRVHLLAVQTWNDPRPTRARCLERNALLHELETFTSPTQTPGSP